MKHSCIALALLPLTSCLAVPGPQAGSSGGSAAVPEQQLSAYLGLRSFANSDFWVPNGDQDALALEYSREKPSDVIGWEVGLAASSDKSSDAGGTVWTGSTQEFYAGVRKSWGEGVVRPYVGAGLSWIDTKWEQGGFSDEDGSFAGYVHGGVQWLLGSAVLVGVDLRGLFGSSVTLGQQTIGGGFEGDADYLQAALSVGWRF